MSHNHIEQFKSLLEELVNDGTDKFFAEPNSKLSWTEVILGYLLILGRYPGTDAEIEGILEAETTFPSTATRLVSTLAVDWAG